MAYRFVFALAPLLAMVSVQPAASAPGPYTFDNVSSTWTVALDGTAVVESDVSFKIANPAISRVAQLPLTWSGSSERLEVVEARLEKKDGRVIPIGKGAIRDDPPAGDAYFHAFSDLRRMLVTIADYEPDDVVFVRTRRDMFRPRVPGGFMTAPILSRTVGWEEANYKIVVPSPLPLAVETRGFEHQVEAGSKLTVHYFRSQHALPASNDAGVLGQFDRMPRFAVSTFLDWDEFARGFSTLLMPHTTVTPAIKAQAEKLTDGTKTPREQAEAIYIWVRDTLHRVAIPLDESLPEPHDAEQVMANRYGDSKDFAVLLHALLAARGISAEFVLLNASSTATIAGPPNLRPLNHMILFVPRFDTYLDATIGVSPFGELPFQAHGKPAIHIGGKGPARRQIPVPAATFTNATMRTDATFGADGELTGDTVTTAFGSFGVWLRGTARGFGDGPAATRAAAITLLREHGTPGTGDLSFPPPTSASDSFTVRGTFKLTNQLPLLNGGFFAPWTGLRILPRIGDFLAGPLWNRDLPASEPTFCYPGRQYEELNLTLPEGRELSSLPPDAEIATDLITFHSHWSLEGRRVSVTREFTTKISGPVCEGDVRIRLAQTLKVIRADMLNQVGITVKPEPVAPAPSIDPDDDLADPMKKD